jgi:hypothetical protein
MFPAMKNTLFAFACLALLSGCADMDMDHLLSFDDPDEPQTVAAETPAPQAAATPPASDAFCRAVATQDATKNAFDAATQQRMLTQGYAQCMALNAR